MTDLILSKTGALPACTNWDDLPWSTIQQQVKRLQVRIAKATREGRRGKVKALQRLLTHSFYAKCLAVRRVVRNKGANTPGVDGILWPSSSRRINAVESLKGKGYKPQPLRRLYIPKKTGAKRPLSIPTMKDRAMQALWQMALDPIAEEWADPNAYGFRPKRSVADAIQQCFHVFAGRYKCRWVFEGDIKACFDRIDHTWLLKNIPMDKTILRKFLKAGFMENGRVSPTDQGTPQGGVISPTLTVMALSGLERLLKETFKNRKVNMVSYADDFIISGQTKEVLEHEVIPIVQDFLEKRGLEISKEKSKITPIEEGFDFLGHTIRKYPRGILLIKPSKANIKSFLMEVRKFIKSNTHIKTENLIWQLNPKIQGWANFYRHAVAKKVFSTVDREIYKALVLWMKKRHPARRKSWRVRKYFRQKGLKNWQFYATLKKKGQKPDILDLAWAQATSIRRYIKIRGIANPYDPQFKDYFEVRDTSSNMVSPRR